DPSYLHSWRLFIVTASLCLGAVLYGLDMNIIGVAVPVITTQFHSLDDIAWYSAAYLLTITAFQPCFGNVYKYFPAKVVFAGSILLFEIGSIICATANSSAVLIFGRAFLGFGASGLLQGALGIVSYIVRLEKVPMYQGFVAGAAAVSATAGPVIGGGLSDHVGWRWCFWINVPIGAAISIAILLFIAISPETNKKNLSLPIAEKLKHLDAVGTIVFLGSIVSLLLVLQWGGQTISWGSGKSIGLFVCFGVCGVIFIALQWRLGEYATIPFRVVRIRSIYMGALVLFTLGIASISLAFYLPLYFQAIQGVSATHSGVNMVAYVAPSIVAIGVTGGLVSRFGYYVPYMVVGRL
ncbi:MFS general substrate transporter, partial [Zopfia rhizophila CBS 207.26]